MRLFWALLAVLLFIATAQCAQDGENSNETNELEKLRRIIVRGKRRCCNIGSEAGLSGLECSLKTLTADNKNAHGNAHSEIDKHEVMNEGSRTLNIKRLKKKAKNCLGHHHAFERCCSATKTGASLFPFLV